MSHRKQQKIKNGDNSSRHFSEYEFINFCLGYFKSSIMSTCLFRKKMLKFMFNLIEAALLVNYIFRFYFRLLRKALLRWLLHVQYNTIQYNKSLMKKLS